MRLPRFPTLPNESRSTDEPFRGVPPTDWGNPSQKAACPSVNLEKACRTCRRNRRGAAAVEFAIVAPLFFLLMFGMVEFGRAIMVQQVLTNAAREGARYAVLDGATSTMAKSKVVSYLTSAGIAGGSATICNSSGAEVEPSTIGYGESVVVSAQVPYNNVAWLPAPWFLKNLTTMSATVVMRRETVQ
ncbi:MAG: TadE/TadG family type IV pilus assembly protein [Thermoguttaceae bacterium]